MILKAELKVKKVLPTQQVTEKFKKREIWFSEDRGGYENIIVMQCTNDKCSLLDNIVEFRTVKIDFFISGREYNGKVFNNLNIISIVDAYTNNAPAPVEAAPIVQSDNDELPF